MLRNYLAAAFGNLRRNWLYAGITIAGLAASFAAAMLVGLYLRDEFTFERFLPGYERAYRLEPTLDLPGRKPLRTIWTTAAMAGFFKVDFPEAGRAARIAPSRGVLKRGGVATSDAMVWADPDFFRIMAYPTLAGDANAALSAPDGLVLTREAARKYFGEDAPLGRTLLVNPAMDGAARGLEPPEAALVSSFHPMRVLAVLEDLPSNSHLDAGVFAAARAPWSPISVDDRHPSPFNRSVLTYVRLKPGAGADAVRRRLPDFAERRIPGADGGRSVYRFRLTPVKDIHFADNEPGPDTLRPPGDRKADLGIAAVAVLILVIAATNFVTLMTARATRRAVEVGVRKAVGARRRDLVVQFMGEALIQVLIALVFAIAITELTLPFADAFLRRALKFDYLGDVALAAALAGGALLITALAGLYPAFALSAFRPAAVLKGGGLGEGGASAGVRQLLVVVQFAILIGLIVMTATIYRQTRFALSDSLRLDTSQVVWLQSPCRSGFTEEAARLPGVIARSCASPGALALGGANSFVRQADGSLQTIPASPVDVGFLELHGLRPLAGRFFSRAHGEDMVLDRADRPADLQPTMVLNETAARRLGYARPQAAIGKTITWMRWSAGFTPVHLPPEHPSRIIGVVRDFTLGSIRTEIPPQIYYVSPAEAPLTILKLDGRATPDALRALGRLWKATGQSGPLGLVFEDAAVQGLYRDVITQEIAIGVCSGLAILIACLGLFALAAFTTERRTKEIGVRKAMGASTADVMRLLLWQFTKPVLWANLVAWPVAFWAMDHWLKGFAYRVDLPPWLFVLAAAAAVLIAWATVSTHAWLVARAKPAAALRYE